MKQFLVEQASFASNRGRRWPTIAGLASVAFSCAVGCGGVDSDAAVEQNGQGENGLVDQGTVLFQDASPDGIRVEVREFSDQNLSMLVTSPLTENLSASPSFVALPESLEGMYLVLHPDATDAPLEVQQLSERLTENEASTGDGAAHAPSNENPLIQKSFGTFVPFASATYYSTNGGTKYVSKYYNWNNPVYQISTTNWLNKGDRAYCWNHSPTSTSVIWYAQDGSFGIAVGNIPANSTGFTTYTGSSGPSGLYTYYASMGTGVGPGVQPGEMGITAHWAESNIR